MTFDKTFNRLSIRLYQTTALSELSNNGVITCHKAGFICSDEEVRFSTALFESQQEWPRQSPDPTLRHILGENDGRQINLVQYSAQHHFVSHRQCCCYVSLNLQNRLCNTHVITNA